MVPIINEKDCLWFLLGLMSNIGNTGKTKHIASTQSIHLVRKKIQAVVFHHRYES